MNNSKENQSKESILKKVSDIKIVKELYPRTAQDTKVIQQYTEAIDELPPIEINQNNVLIDGAHRLSAHKQLKIEDIKCFITETSTDKELYRLGLRRNRSHGYQLSSEDKKRAANFLCGDLTEDEIREELSISHFTYVTWTKNKREQIEKDRDGKVIDLWMKCYSLRDIEGATKVPKSTVEGIIKRVSENVEKYKSGQMQDFQPQLYNIWNFSKNNNETKHFGNVPTEITENLLYYYTEPFDVVFDPFGGGGATIDACKKWYRRYYVSDIAPTEIALQKGMRTHDITIGLPEDLPKPKLVFLDPPYWRQAKGQYTDKTTDLSNMELPDFYKQFENLFKELKQKMADGGYLAFIIANTQWANDNHKVEPHSHKIWNIAEAKGFEFEQLIHVPYSTEQYNGNQVNIAKEHKLILQLNRELVVLRKK